VLVHRENDLESEALKAVEAVTSGSLIVIGFVGWDPVNPDGDDLVVKLLHGISFWAMPTGLSGGGMAAFDVLLAAIVSAEHGWQPATTNEAYCSRKWITRGGRLLKKADYTVYEFPASIVEDLANPVPRTV